MIAAALQDHERAYLAGQRTRGKASVQSLVYLERDLGRAGQQLRLTTGIFTRANGKALNRFYHSKPEDDWGVRPNSHLEVRTSPALRRQLREWRLLHDLRPANSRASLPLDDISKDPVLYVGWQELQRRLK
jgi:hypothetical protein